MNLDEWRLSFISIGFLLIVLTSAPIILEIFPPRYEPFIAMAVLGENKTTDNYYPGNNTDIPLMEPSNWSIYLYNHLGVTEYISIKIKILDAQTPPPNNTLSVPSPAPTIYEQLLMLGNNETKIIPFDWSIIEASNVSDRLFITKMIINGQILDSNVSVSNNQKSRLVFELWTYDHNLRTFKFDLDLEGKNNCVWNQIWFNLKIN